MPRPWEHIHRLHLFDAVAVLCQDGGVAGGGGGVAADVDQAAGSHPDDGGQGGYVAALAGRVDDDDVGGQAFGGQTAGGFAGVGAEKAAPGRDGFAHPGGVGLGALDGLGDHLDPDQGAAARRHGQADGAHSAIEIEKQVAGGGVRVGGGHAVELLGAGGVHLVKGEGPQPDRHPAEGVLDEAGTAEDPVLPAEDDVGLVGVDVDEDGADRRKAAAEGGGQLGGVRQAGPGADQADHDLAAVRAPPQKDVPHQPLAGSFVVGADVVLFQQAAQEPADLVQDGGLQFAVAAGDDPVAAPGVKADAGGWARPRPPARRSGGRRRPRRPAWPAARRHSADAAGCTRRRARPPDSRPGCGRGRGPPPTPQCRRRTACSL